MEPIHYVRALRQWWRVIALLTLIGVLAAGLSWSPSTDAYSATRTLVADDATDSSSPAPSLARAAFLSTNSEVLQQAGKQLGMDPADLAGSISATPDESLGGVFITATAASSARATQIANTSADVLISYLTDRANKTYNEEVANARAVRDAAVTPDDVQSAQTRVNQLVQQGSPGAGLSPIGSTSVQLSGAGTSRTLRALIGGLMGLLLGVVIALLLARFDTRIRTRDGAEAAFGVPVIAEVPPLRRRLRNSHAIITSYDPESLAAETYRGLRTALVVAANASNTSNASQRSRGRGGKAEDSARAKGRVVMVVSPGMNEGKTTTAANLAVAYAETGRSVLLLGCDLRRPGLHGFFDLTQSPGLTDVFAAAGTSRSLESVIRDTSYPGVRIATSGNPVKHAGEYLTRGLDVIQSARDLADVVIIDTAPLLATDDAAVLMPVVDTVVVVCKSGLTRNESAARARELLARLSAPVAGVGLIGAEQLASARSYYRYRSEYRSKRQVKDPDVASAEGLVELQPLPDGEISEVAWHEPNGVAESPNGRSTSDAPLGPAEAEGGERATGNGTGDLSSAAPDEG